MVNPGTQEISKTENSNNTVFQPIGYRGGYMSQSNIQAKIRSNPKFAELVGKRTRFAVILSLVVLVPYYTYMLLVSLQPQLFTGKISDGSVITIGWPIAALIVRRDVAESMRTKRSASYLSLSLA